MLVAFQLCKESDLSVKEISPLVREFKESPTVGDRMSLGCGERWEIAKIEPFLSDSGTVLVAYLNRIDIPLLPEQDWDCNRWDREFQFDGGSLSIVLWEDGRKTLMYHYGNDKPVENEMTPSFKTESGLLVRSEPFDTFTKVESFQPKEDSYYKAVYLCWNKRLTTTIATIGRR